MTMAIQSLIDTMTGYYAKQFNIADQGLQKKINYALKKNEKQYNYLKDIYLNDNLSDAVKKVIEKNKILEYNHELVQQYHPIYLDPPIRSVLSWRSHFYAPRKPFFGKYIDTYWYNITFIWIYTLLLYITLYYESVKKTLDFFSKFKFKKENAE